MILAYPKPYRGATAYIMLYARLGINTHYAMRDIVFYLGKLYNIMS